MSDNFDLNSYLKEVQDMSDLYYVSLIVLSQLKNTDYSSIAELSILLDRSNFTKLIEYYQGDSIKVPTASEIKEVMISIAIYYYYILLGKTWYQTLSRLGISRNDKDNSDKLWDNYKTLVAKINLYNPKLSKDMMRGHEDEF